MVGNRCPQFPRQLHLPDADLPLDIPRAVIIVKIQADLPDRPDLSLSIPFGHLFDVLLPETAGFVGMDTADGNSAPVRRRISDGAPGRIHIRADNSVPGDSVLTHPRKRFFPVRVKGFFIYMAMTVKPFDHPMMAPSSTPSPTLTSLRLPLSSMADRIMPWLSIPASFAVFRLVITATCVPTSVSGS